MSKEKELYRDTLECFKDIADRKYPDHGATFNLKQAADICGVSTRTLQRRGMHEFITLPQMARSFS